MKAESLFALRDERRSWVLYGCLYFFLGLVCYWGLKDHLLDTHDAETFTDHPAISADFTFFFSTEKATASGRLVDELLIWLGYSLWGHDPAFFHLLSAACHLLAGFALALLFRRLGAGLELCFLGGLLFMLNVAHIQAVHWISALEYPLALLLGTLAVYSYAHFTLKASALRLALFYALLATSLLAHIAMAMLWPFCLLWSWRSGMAFKRALKYLVPFGLPLLPVLSLIALTTSRHTSTSDALSAYSLANVFDLLLGMGRVLLWFCGRLFTTAHWLPLPIYKFQTWEMPVGALFLGLMLWLFWRRVIQADLWAVWALLFLLPFLFLTEQIITDMPVGPSRYLYFSSAGSSLVLAWIAQWVGCWLVRQFGSVGRSLYIAFVAALIAYSAVMVKRAEAFSFYTSGRSYLTVLELDTGVAQLRRALDTGADLIDAHDAYARMGLVLLHKPQEAEALLKESIALYPESIPLNIYRLAALSIYGGAEDAEQALKQLMELSGIGDVAPVIGQSYFNIAEGLYHREDAKKAALAYEHSQFFLPDRRSTMMGWARVLFVLGRYGEAIVAFERIVRVVGGNAQDFYVLARLYSLQGDNGRARQAYAEVLRLAPQSAEAAKAREILDDP